jgi:hypothetical protein
VVVVSYHTGDSFSILNVTDRIMYYGVSGTPDVWFNGLSDIAGGFAQSNGEAGIQYMYNLYTAKIQSELSRIANNIPFDITLRGQINPTNSIMTAYINTTTGYPRTVKAIFLVTEDAIPVSASNGQTILNAVARRYSGTKSFMLTTSGSTTVGVSMGSFSYYNSSELKPVFMLQDATTKEIIGAVTEFTLPTNVSYQWQLYD